MMEIRDYNGQGRWSRESIERRFESYAQRFGTSIGELKSQVYETEGVRRVYPLVTSVIEGIERRDPACIEIGVELIEESSSMPFGMILKSNAARALRRSADLLTEDQRVRIRKRVGDMLITQYMPREFSQYVKLVRGIGFESELPRVEAEADLDNSRVRRNLEKIRVNF